MQGKDTEYIQQLIDDYFEGKPERTKYCLLISHKEK